MATAAMARPHQWTGERIFFTTAAATMLTAVIVGFAPVYYLLPVQAPPPGHVPASPLVHLHGAVFSLWMLLYTAQSGFIAAGRRDLHIRLGAIGLGLVLTMIAVGTLAALYQVGRHSGAPDVPPLSWLAIPLLSVAGFAPLFLLALKFRKRPAMHKRLMLLGMVCMIGAGFGRMTFLPAIVGICVMPNLYTVALAAWDVKSTGRVQPVTTWGGAVAAAATIGPVLVWRTPAWLAFAGWAAGLVA